MIGNVRPMWRASSLAGPLVAGQLVAPTAQLLDGDADPLARAGEQADVLEHGEHRHEQRAQRGARRRDGRGHTDQRHFPLVGEHGSLPSVAMITMLAAGLVGQLRGFHRLFRLTREREREAQRCPGPVKFGGS